MRTTVILMDCLRTMSNVGSSEPNITMTRQIFCLMSLLLIIELRVLVTRTLIFLSFFFPAGTFSSLFSRLEDALRAECLSKAR
jgi:hypothetical protein